MRRCLLVAACGLVVLSTPGAPQKAPTPLVKGRITVGYPPKGVNTLGYSCTATQTATEKPPVLLMHSTTDGAGNYRCVKIGGPPLASLYQIWLKTDPRAGLSVADQVVCDVSNIILGRGCGTVDVSLHEIVVVVRRDTIVVARVDTVIGPVVTRVDTIVRVAYAPLQREPGAFIALGAGANIPMNDIRAAFKDGYALQAQAGYFPMNSPLGVRADATWGTIRHRATECGGCPDPAVWTIGGDVILRNFVERTSRLNPVLYAFAGGGWTHVGSVSAAQRVNTGTGIIDVSGGHAYWDVGPGVDFTVGGWHVYAEGRYMSIATSGTRSHMFPVSAGLKFY